MAKIKLASGNFLKDRGYANAPEGRQKFQIINEIALAIEDRNLSIVDSASR